MSNLFLKGAVVMLALLNTKAYATEMDNMYYWSNTKGLVKADGCTLTAARNPKLGFIKNKLFTNSTPLASSKGGASLKINGGSLVKLGEIDPNASMRAIGIVGINAFSTPTESDAVRADSGYVNVNSVDSISKNFIQITNDYMNVGGGTYWKAYGNDKFLKLNCPEFFNTKDYLVFNVYPADGGRMVARVGVSSAETELFKNITTYKDIKIYNKFSDTVTDESNSLAEIEALPESGAFDVKELTPAKKDANPPVKQKVTPPIKEDVPPRDQPKYTYQDSSTQNGLDSIICTEQGYINVRNEDLSQVLFTTRTGDRVKVFQGWGNNRFDGNVGGKTYNFTKVEFLDNEDYTQKVGYVVSAYIEAKSNCVYERSYRDSLVPEDTSFTGLNDVKCCNFPTVSKVTLPFNEGMRRFGGSRGGGSRAHAANDLYRYINEPIYAVAPGVVIRGLAYFYQDTFSVEVLHSGGFVVRYGELTGKMASNVSMGKQVRMGDRIGYIGKVSSGCCEPMLHFELYSGDLKGPLTQEGAEVNGVLYNRRRDLLNPTKYLLKWENAKF